MSDGVLTNKEIQDLVDRQKRKLRERRKECGLGSSTAGSSRSLGHERPAIRPLFLLRDPLWGSGPLSASSGGGSRCGSTEREAHLSPGRGAPDGAWGKPGSTPPAADLPRSVQRLSRRRSGLSGGSEGEDPARKPLRASSLSDDERKPYRRLTQAALGWAERSASSLSTHSAGGSTPRDHTPGRLPLRDLSCYSAGSTSRDSTPQKRPGLLGRGLSTHSASTTPRERSVKPSGLASPEPRRKPTFDLDGMASSERSGGVIDPYHAAIKMLYLITMRQRRQAQWTDDLLARWQLQHPDLKRPTFYGKSPNHYLVDDLLTEVVSYFPAVVVATDPSRQISFGAAICEEDPTPAVAPSPLRIPYRYRFLRESNTFSRAVERARDGDMVAVLGTCFVPSTVAIDRSVTVFGVEDAQGKPGTVTSGSGAAYTMLSVKPDVKMTFRNLTLSSDNVTLSVQGGAVDLAQCEVVGGVVQKGGKLALHRTRVKAGSKLSATLYGILAEDAARVTVTRSFVSGFSTGVKVTESVCRMSDTRVCGSISSGMMAKKGSDVLIERVDFEGSSSNASPDIQVSSAAKRLTMLDSKVGASVRACVKVIGDTSAPVAAPPRPAAAGGAPAAPVLPVPQPPLPAPLASAAPASGAPGVLPQSTSRVIGGCTMQLLRNEFRAEKNALCICIPQSAPDLAITAEQNMFYSEGCAVSSRLTDPSSKLTLANNTFEQPELVAIANSGLPSTIASSNNRFTRRL
eukprot:TRINITY_DN821_c3_g2_i1.p1 TRINITY_DN821_c3_g2~~TRINITY_DN821_c3_g2_i1.p1  ORF type:complete len:742 (+),score=189.97 TRINITY_DN821_c3_g2_i1:86-2311(+)